MIPPPEVASLVERFHDHREAYRSGRYNETQLRREFVDPFFKTLGWDVDNERGYAEPYKEVIHEDAIKVGGLTKAPDYCFRVGGTRKFFVETKKPSIDIRDDVHPAFQLRRYAWSAKLPLSILTDFEEFAVYDCRTRPSPQDKAATGRILYLTYTEYLEEWDTIASVFSRDAVWKGSFDKFAESKKKKRGTQEVDEAFLEEIESWRDLLARNLALRNKRLSARELNFAVQAILDRVIFLRICEDRGIEEYGRLLSLLNSDGTYRRLHELFQAADARYNSGLFHFEYERGRAGHPDELTPHLALDDEPLKKIIRNLYYPDSPYEFAVLPADILGQVYERFLGKVIRLTPAHRAVVEEKPEVKKSGGVFYTPTYVVEYIVQHTLGSVLDGKSPRQAAKLRILDPACGSGSFLIAAYQKLLDWHRDAYVGQDPRKHGKRLYRGPGGEWRLTTAEKKQILLNSIYGVDIDPQAVEVTKLSLLLKVLEGESAETIQAQLRLFQERALPDLSNNIKCGNSLIGPDFYERAQTDLLDRDGQHDINAFDWTREFPEIVDGSQGGFDVVIGNPPYIRMEEFREIKDYLKTRYACHDERSDLYVYFVEKAHGLLNRRGRFGMILSNKFLRSNYGRPLRNFLSEVAHIERIVDLAGLPVFKGATVRTVILITSRDPKRSAATLFAPVPEPETFAVVESEALSLTEATRDNTFEVAPSAFERPIWTFAPKPVDELFTRLQSKYTPLKQSDAGLVCRGVVSGLTEAYVIDQDTRRAILKSNPSAEEIIKPFVVGRHVRRYRIDYEGLYLIYTYHGVEIDRYPGVEAHLKPFKSKLEKRATQQEWYELQQPQLAFAPYMEQPKIIFPDIATSPRFAIDDVGYYGSNTIYFIPQRDLFLCGILNSRLAHFYFLRVCAGLEGKKETYLRFFGQYLEGFPLPIAEPSSAPDPSLKEAIVGQAERMISLQAQVREARTAHERTLVEREIEGVDGQIDTAVYELYAVSAKEKSVIEEATS